MTWLHKKRTFKFLYEKTEKKRDREKEYILRCTIQYTTFYLKRFMVSFNVNRADSMAGWLTVVDRKRENIYDKFKFQNLQPIEE